MTSEPICPQCGSSDLDGEIELFDSLCETCGYVVHDISKAVECETPALENKGSDDEEIDQEWSEFVTVENGTQKQVADGLGFLEQIADEIGLSTSERERAAEIYAGALEERITVGRKKTQIIASCVFLATQELGKARPLKFIAGPDSISEDSVIDHVRLIRDGLEIDPVVPRPEDYLTYLGQFLPSDESTLEETEDLLIEVQGSTNISGTNPAAWAGAALYSVSSEGVTQREIAEACGVTKETIRVRLLEIRRWNER
ncbi:transcription initiation factor IIB family protein [Natronorarus salvus]|uniref:transcription initiation factor IIB family protein n=1 Tax=Natronorarus salvus TaxID=3117733 RepID=UPI002F26431D